VHEKEEMEKVSGWVTLVSCGMLALEKGQLWARDNEKGCLRQSTGKSCEAQDGECGEERGQHSYAFFGGVVS
jgi:hypothetical protein